MCERADVIWGMSCVYYTIERPATGAGGEARDSGFCWCKVYYTMDVARTLAREHLYGRVARSVPGENPQFIIGRVVCFKKHRAHTKMGKQ